MTESPSSHLLSQLRLSVRVASDRIEDAARKIAAYEALIESLERRIRVLKSQLYWSQIWPWVALAATLCAYGLCHFGT